MPKVRDTTSSNALMTGLPSFDASRRQDVVHGIHKVVLVALHHVGDPAHPALAHVVVLEQLRHGAHVLLAQVAVRFRAPLRGARNPTGPPQEGGNGLDLVRGEELVQHVQELGLVVIHGVLELVHAQEGRQVVEFGVCFAAHIGQPRRFQRVHSQILPRSANVPYVRILEGPGHCEQEFQFI